MKKMSQSVLIALVTLMSVHSASAATYKGKCARKAEDAAIKYWADVPNPDPNLEYITVSSKATGLRSDTYIVVLALSDGNEEAFAKYQVTFEDAGRCSKPSVRSAR